MRRHHKMTLAILALLATLPFFVQADRPEPPPPTGTAPQPEAPQTEAARTLLAALPVRAQMPQLRGDPFSPEAPTARHGTRSVSAAALQPVAPPNPYRFAGELRQPGATRRFLVRGDVIVEVKAGDVLDDGYRVDAVGESEVVLVHLASGIRHSVALNTAAPAAATPAPAAAALGAPVILFGAPGARTPPRALREG